MRGRRAQPALAQGVRVCVGVRVEVREEGDDAGMLGRRIFAVVEATRQHGVIRRCVVSAVVIQDQRSRRLRRRGCAAVRGGEGCSGGRMSRRAHCIEAQQVRLLRRPARPLPRHLLFGHGADARELVDGLAHGAEACGTRQPLERLQPPGNRQCQMRRIGDFSDSGRRRDAQ